MLRTTFISLMLAISLNALADDVGMSITAAETWQVSGSAADYSFSITRGSEVGGHKLIINRSDEFIDVFDLNMTLIDRIKPDQAIDVCATLKNTGDIAVSVGGSDVIYLRVPAGSTLIARNNNGSQS